MELGDGVGGSVCEGDAVTDAVTDTVADGDTDGDPVNSFNQPFTMTLFYNDSDWQNAGIADENDLNVYWWNGSTWIGMLPCAGCSHDTVHNKFVLVLDHLTEFTIMKSEGTETYVYLPLIIKKQ